MFRPEIAIITATRDRAMIELPLFPLPVVLFPNSALPLHIFEERYKILISECIDGQKEFGIKLIHEGKVSPVGCTALVKDVIRRCADGRMDIVVAGRHRYMLDQINSRETPYLVGSVEFFTCPADEIDRALALETLELYNALIGIVYKDPKCQLSLEEITDEASFLLAQKAGMDLLQRQHLLELASENERLQVLREYLRKVIPRLETMEEVNRVISSDGYL